MKIGLLAYSTNTGLGIQTLNFYKHMQPTKTLLVDLHKFNGMKTHHERFQDGEVMLTRNMPDCQHMDWLTNDVDIVFICETPLNYCLMEKAKAKGVLIRVLRKDYCPKCAERLQNEGEIEGFNSKKLKS